jgi:hypothetical protein
MWNRYGYLGFEPDRSLWTGEGWAPRQRSSQPDAGWRETPRHGPSADRAALLAVPMPGLRPRLD